MKKISKENMIYMSIGVIGGADGPTAIFVGSAINWLLVGIVGVAILAGVILAIVLKKRRTQR